MLKKANKYLFLSLAVLLHMGLPTFSQQVADTSFSPSKVVLSDSVLVTPDSLSLAQADSLGYKTDSTRTDTLLKEKSKWDFLTTGGNDSTYYSFYGHIFTVDDTNKVEFWNYSINVHEPQVYMYDSILEDFHITHPAFEKTINNGFLGNRGLAVKSNIFAEPNPKTGFIFAESFTPYLFNSSEVSYFNVKKPFTDFDVNIGPNEEQNLDLIHTQNINPYLNAFIQFKNFSGEGSYIDQETRNNAGTIGASYTKGRLATHFNWVFNRIEVSENGGVVDTYLITDSSLREDANMRLTDGSNYIKERQLFFDQKIGFLKTNVPDSATLGSYWFSLQYTFNQHKSIRIYEDADDSYYNSVTKDTLNLYANNFSGGATFDSTHYFHRNHNFRINLEENSRTYPFVGAYFGYGQQNTDYYYFNTDTLNYNSRNKNIRSYYFEAGIFRLKGKKFKFEGNYKLYIGGYRQGDMQLDGYISQKFGKYPKQLEIKGYGGIYVQTPDYLLTQYYSNHYRWENNFNSEKRTSLNFSLKYPFYKTEIGTRFNLLSDYIYFNTEALPTQYNQVFTVFDVYANNSFKFSKFGLRTRLNYQNTGNSEVLPLPMFSGYAALYWEPHIYFKDTGGRLKFQLGVDTYYWTSYYGQAYSPALAQFHNQKEQQVGNYPFVGAFWNLQLKRLRFFIRGEHVNFGRTKPLNYFYTPSYPTNQMVIRYGLNWTFYD